MSSIASKLKFLAVFAETFQARFMEPLWQKYPAKDTDPWDSLGLFLEGYAFERQGRPADYPHSAADVLMEMKRDRHLLSVESQMIVWELFKQHFTGDRKNKLNEANNPLCRKGYKYSKKQNEKPPEERQTKGCSAIEFGEKLWEKYRITVISYIKNKLEQDKALNSLQELQEINGIGPKIASLFLRDIAVKYDIKISKNRHLLQPVDKWVGRIVQKLGGVEFAGNENKPKLVRAVQDWIVENAQSIASPEELNQGFWYFGSQVAGSTYRLEKSLDDLNCAKDLASEHKRTLIFGAYSIRII